MIGTIIKKLRTDFYTCVCKRTAKQYGNGLHINHWQQLSFGGEYIDFNI